MSKQKNALEKLDELQKRIGLMVKQYNDLSKSESLDLRLAYGFCDPFKGDDSVDPREIDFLEPDEDDDNWSNSGCSWQTSGC